MKKCSTLFILLAIVLMSFAGCDSKDVPYNEVHYKDEVLQYGESRASIESKIGTGEAGKTFPADVITYDGGIEIYYRDDAAVYFSIIENDIATYNRISLGDSKKSLSSEFSGKIREIGSSEYDVGFINGKEVDSSTAEVDFLIMYFFDDDDKVETIKIMDSQYAKTMK